MSDCPDREVLERLVAGGLAGAELDALDRHVGDCAHCQQALEDLTNDWAWKAELRRDASLSLDDTARERAANALSMTARSTAIALERMAKSAPAVPGYDIEGELGRGGMGVVYRARHVRLNRLCALKMILAGAHASPEVAARFVTEAEAIARLEHPAIVQIRNIGDADGLPFLELEYVVGGSLDGHLDGTPWPAARAARLAEQMAQGIAEAHLRGIVHRDLKPTNVLLTADGAPKIGDFGLAKILDRQAMLTQSESIMGSPSYMAPEQALGLAKEAGAAVDIYSLGAILYELLTGRPPFRGTTALETVEHVKSTEPIAPSRLVPGVPRDVETICLKCLQKEPLKRYESAQALGDDVRRFLDGRPILARRTNSVERAWRWCRRNQLVAALTGIAALAIIILAIGATVAAFTFRAQRDEISASQQRLQIAERQTKESLMNSLIAQARTTRASGQVGQRFESLRALETAALIAHELELPADRLDTIRDAAIACLAVPDLQRAGREIIEPAATILSCFDPALSRYALRRQSGEVLVRRFADDQELARFTARGDRNLYVLCFSPDGRYLMTTHEPGAVLSVWDVDRKKLALEVMGSGATAARFSPDSRSVAVADRAGELSIHNLENKRRRLLWSGVPSAHDLAFRPDGLQIAVTSGVSTRPSTCQILETESGRVVRTIALNAVSCAAWSPDGATLATPGDDRKIALWDSVSGIKRGTLEGSTDIGLHAAFHPAGTLLASNGWESRLRIWDTATGRPIVNLAGKNPLDPAFSRDGRIVVELEGRLITYRVDTAAEYRSLVHASGEPIAYHRPSIRHDNRLLAVASSQGVVFWDLESGIECGLLPIASVRMAIFEPSGDLLTSSNDGVHRWPIALDRQRGEFRIGPPVEVIPDSVGHIAEDRLGHIVAVAQMPYIFAKVKDSGHVRPFGPLDEGRYVAVSPDGKWLATGSHHLGAQIWRISDREKVADLAVSTHTRVGFSPDGRWLMTDSAPCKLWSTESWVLAREIGGNGLCFSPDSRLVAILDAYRIVRLVEAETGRVLARLESPGALAIPWAAFSPDGSKLVVVLESHSAVHVWDLRAIRQRLSRMGLDWDAAAIPDNDDGSLTAMPLPPVKLELGELACDTEPFSYRPAALIERHTARIKTNPSDAEAYHHRGHALLNAGRFAESIDDLSAALLLRPADAHLQKALAQACKFEAWELIARRDSPRSAERAVVLARRAVDLAPSDATNDNALGVALYSAHRYADAIAPLERSLAESQGEHDGFDLYFLAMAYQRQGQRERARICFDRGERWRKTLKVMPYKWDQELSAFRREASAVLAGPADELPADVFAPVR